MQLLHAYFMRAADGKMAVVEAPLQERELTV
jgi:hypothetical protein